MSDPANLNVPSGTALSSDMMYGLKPCAPRSRVKRIFVSPINGSVFEPTQQIQLELPVGEKNTVHDPTQSYLKFSVQCTSTAACANTSVSGPIYIDNSAYSFIQTFECLNGSNTLETINEYGQLANFLIDTSMTQSDKAGLSSLIGTNNIHTMFVPGQNSANIDVAGGVAAHGLVLPTISSNIQVPGDRSGMFLASTTGFATAIPYTFCLPLLSGVIGMNAQKCLPVGKLKSPIRLNITLSANDEAICYGIGAVGAKWRLVNVEYIGAYITIDDDSYDLSSSAQGIPEYIATNSYRQTNAYIASASAGELNIQIGFALASMTGLYARFRPYSSNAQGANATQAYRKSGSVNPNFATAYFKIGSTCFPNSPIKLLSGYVGTGSEAFAEILKSFHGLSSMSCNSAITSDMFNVATSSTLGWSLPFTSGDKLAGVKDTSNNAFAIGIELQTFSNRNDTILSGISTLGTGVFFSGSIANNMTAGGTLNKDIIADFFCSHDLILIIQDGVISAKK